jgi:hypothetical protein
MENHAEPAITAEAKRGAYLNDGAFQAAIEEIGRALAGLERWYWRAIPLGDSGILV